MSLPLYVPTEEQLRRPSPGDYWDGAVGHSPHIRPMPWWFTLVAVITGLSPFIAALLHTLTR